MFGSSSKPPAPAPERKQDMSVIAQGVTLTGDIDGQGDVSIDGTFQGQIKCHKLVIGETGSFRGKAKVTTLVIKGRFRGEVEADDVHMMRTADVEGRVHHDVLEVEEGAKVQGHYTRGDRMPRPAPEAGRGMPVKPVAPRASGGEERLPLSQAESRTDSSTESSKPPAGTRLQ